VREAPSQRPVMVSVRLDEHGRAAGTMLVLTDLNPEFDSIELGQVNPLSWSDAKSEEGPQAGLILPVGFDTHKRYPLVVVLYNVYSGKEFLVDAPLFTSYPVQAFAGHGYAVLLMNVPEGAFNYKHGDFAAAKTAEIDKMVNAVRAGTDLLVCRGIADPKRMAIMGWSYGAFWTDYIITHFPDWFRAAASGEGDHHNPGLY